MPYYRGDFYRGDFYTGDPGFFGILGRAAGRLVQRIPGVSETIKAVRGLGAGGREVVVAAPSAAGVAATGIVRRGVGAVVQHPVLSAAGAAGAIGVLGGVLGERIAGAPGVGMKGFHMSKPRRGVASHLVRNRRMRVTNPRALRRSLRRIHGFARIARRVLHFTHPRAARGRVRFKFRKRKAA